ncbi:hypothetical protein Prudu_019872, partial [Prunus dulcis]
PNWEEAFCVAPWRLLGSTVLSQCTALDLGASGINPIQIYTTTPFAVEYVEPLTKVMVSLSSGGAKISH